jgi:hypothetical protein
MYEEKTMMNGVDNDVIGGGVTDYKLITRLLL